MVAKTQIDQLVAAGIVRRNPPATFSNPAMAVAKGDTYGRVVGYSVIASARVECVFASA